MLPDSRTRVAHGIFCERNVFTRAPQLSQREPVYTVVTTVMRDVCPVFKEKESR